MEPIDDGVNDVEHRILRPLRVVEDHDEWTVRCEHLEQPSHRPRGIGRERLVHTEHLGEAIANSRAVRFVGKLLPGRRSDRLGIRPRCRR